ncbi:MAG: GGDEF domain-containing protein [Magnetospirillum sp.]|nr:GGDEF domain-containing protein [Magnetospirillum sp.]
MRVTVSGHADLRAELVDTIAELVHPGDRDLLERVLVDSLAALVPGAGVALVRFEHGGEAWTSEVLHRAGGFSCTKPCTGCPDPGGLFATEPDVQVNVFSPMPRPGGCSLVVEIPFRHQLGRSFLMLSGRPMTDADERVVLGLSTIFKNYLDAISSAQIDGLTQLFNRKTFDERLNAIIEQRRQSATHLSDAERRHDHAGHECWLAVADIDHFKRINDTFGHVFGDEVLLLFSGIMRKCTRRSDLLFRYGGEEFAIVLTDVDAEGALATLERFRHAVETHRFPRVGQVTCSLGYTHIGGNEVPTALFGRADTALYHAKGIGRNRVCNYEALAAEGLLHGPTEDEDDVTLF